MSVAVASMTGFARAEGSADGLTWVWELRSVNGRGSSRPSRQTGVVDKLTASLATKSMPRWAIRRG